MQTVDAARSGIGRMKHHGQGRELFHIFIINLLLKILTLGIYHFWAKTRVRAYVWSHTVFDEEPFEYGGLGKELFYGAAVAFVVFGLMVLLIIYLPAAKSLVYLVALVLVDVGSFAARRYFLSRTRLRAIRFGQSGSAFKYALKLLGERILVAITFGLYWPFMRQRVLAYKVNNTWFGSERFTYSGRGRDMFGKFFVSLLLTVPTLGLIWFRYLATEFGYNTRHIHFADCRLDVRFTGSELFGLRFGNLVILLFTLGLAYPAVLLRSLRFLFDRLSVAGQPDYATVIQSGIEAPATGEGLAEVFGVSGTLLGIARL